MLKNKICELLGFLNFSTGSSRMESEVKFFPVASGCYSVTSTGRATKVWKSGHLYILGFCPPKCIWVKLCGFPCCSAPIWFSCLFMLKLSLMMNTNLPLCQVKTHELSHKQLPTYISTDVWKYCHCSPCCSKIEMGG